MSNITEKVLNWIATGDVGESSKAIAFCAAGSKGSNYHPYDPADLNRCLLLIKAIPEVKDHFDSISKLSDVWRNLIENWDKLEECFIGEVGLNWSKGQRLHATKTYSMMRNLIEESE